MELVGEVVIHQTNAVKRVRQYYKGAYPDKGIIVKGLSGIETMVETEIIKSLRKFNVFDITPRMVLFQDISE